MNTNSIRIPDTDSRPARFMARLISEGFAARPAPCSVAGYAEIATDAPADVVRRMALALRISCGWIPSDPLQGYSPADIVVGPAGQTLAEAAASEVAGDGPEPIDGPARYRGDGGYDVSTPGLRLAAATAALRSIAMVPTAYHGRGAEACRDEMARIAVDALGAIAPVCARAPEVDAVLAIMRSEPHHDSGGWCLDVYVSGGPVRS